jgi:hypothetical protein
LFDIAGHEAAVAGTDYACAFSALQVIGDPVGAGILVLGIGFDSDSTPYTIELYDRNISDTVPVDTIRYVPEPAMVSLMAIGYLGLRRRKKN